MKGILKLVDFTETPNAGDDILRNLGGIWFHEIFSKKCKLTREGQEGDIKKLVVVTEDQTYNIESHNVTPYFNLDILDVEKEYVIKMVGDNIYLIIFGEEKFEMDTLLDIKKEYEEIIKKYPTLLKNEQLYTDKQVAGLLLLIGCDIGQHMNVLSTNFIKWRKEIVN